MKKAIEKALKNGLDVRPVASDVIKVELCRIENLSEDTLIVFWLSRKEGGYARSFNIYRLIFGTDFIEKLVGENPHCKSCGLTQRFCPHNEEGISCEHPNPCYHRSQLANMTLEEMKDYINKLGEV